VFVGLQPERALGGVEASDEYRCQCRQFLLEQLRIVEPRLVATLGIPAAQQFALSGATTSVVALDHPYYAYAKGYEGPECAEIVVRNSLKLKHAAWGVA
jgi:uracil-DNA glycosylase